MISKQLENWILENYQGVIVTDAFRERSFYYNPDNSLPKGKLSYSLVYSI